MPIDYNAVKFQSTLSVRRATHFLGLSDIFLMISIHALRKESDLDAAYRKAVEWHFNPRSP